MAAFIFGFIAFTMSSAIFCISGVILLSSLSASFICWSIMRSMTLFTVEAQSACAGALVTATSMKITTT